MQHDKFEDWIKLFISELKTFNYFTDVFVMLKVIESDL